MTLRLPSLVSATAMLASALCLGACDRQSEGNGQPEPAQSDVSAVQAGAIDTSHAGEPLPDVTIALPDGTEQPLTAFTGEPLLINLWATWCGPCVIEMPMLDQLAADNEGDLRVLTVSQDLQGAEKVQPFFDEQGFARLEPWMDTQNNLGFHYKGGVLPMTIYYDADGKEIWRMMGEHDWTSPETQTMLKLN